MPKFSRGGKTLQVQMQARSPKQAEEIARLRRELEHIALLTTSGGLTDLTTLMWNNLIAQCKDRLNPFSAIEDANRSLAEAYEAEVKRRFKHP